MRARISHYRRAPIGSSEDPMIGCRFVRDVRFFPLDAIADPPPDFARNIVQGKGYDLADESVAGYFGLLLQLLLGGTVVELDFSQSWHRPGPVFGDPRLAPYRLGQRSFQAVVLDAYHRRCAISGTHIPPVLQAAHIRPVTKGGEHRLDNGLLLRSDVHTLFDRGYLAVNPEYRLLVSPRLREDFHNGDQFYARDGQVIELPGTSGRSAQPRLPPMASRRGVQSLITIACTGAPITQSRPGAGRSRRTQSLRLPASGAKVRSPGKRPVANALLTTAVDTWGRMWTPRCPNMPPGLLGWTVVDSCGPGNPSEKRKVDSSILSLTTRPVPFWPGQTST
jgi:HNH endonuclease